MDSFRLVFLAGWGVFLCAGLSFADYHPRDALITDALDRAEASHSRKKRAVQSESFTSAAVPRSTAHTVRGSLTTQPAAKRAPVSVKSAAKPVRAAASPVKQVQEVPVTPVEKTAAVKAVPAPVQPEIETSVSAPQPKPDAESFAYRYFDLSNPQNEMEVGTEVFDYSYREEGFMKLDGMMYGVFMDYQHRFRENPVAYSWKDILASRGGINLLKFDARFAGGGDIKYRSEGTGIHEGENHYAFETRLMAGYEIPWKKPEVVITPYAGFGYRYLLDDNGGTQTTTGHWGYDRESNYYYVPIGLELTKFYRHGWSAGAKLEYDWFLSGKQYSHYEDAPGYTQTVENNQPKGYGLRGSLRVAREGERFEFFIEPFVRYWHIKDSDYGATSETGGIEPNNRTEEYGARMGVRF